MKSIAIVLLLASTCISQEISQSQAYFVWVTATVALTSGTPTPAPTPKPKPDNQKCSNCGGDGELGDGRTKIKCPVCDGKGYTASVVKPKPTTPSVKILEVCPPGGT